MALILSPCSVFSVALRAQLHNEVPGKQNGRLHLQLCRWGFSFPGPNTAWAPPASDPDSQHSLLSSVHNANPHCRNVMVKMNAVHRAHPTNRKGSPKGTHTELLQPWLYPLGQLLVLEGRSAQPTTAVLSSPSPPGKAGGSQPYTSPAAPRTAEPSACPHSTARCLHSTPKPHGTGGGCRPGMMGPSC